MTLATEKAPLATGRQAILSQASDPVYAPGRREFFKYRQLAASEGEMTAQVMSTNEGLTEPTGWHYHLCESQFIYVLKGTLDLDLEDGTSVHMVAGDSLLLPGGMKHNETSTSTDFEVLEVMLPKLEGTVPCDPPA
ncbi:MAG: cupin domain-containing protein [Quisquiliibacterium sp.]